MVVGSSYFQKVTGPPLSSIFIGNNIMKKLIKLGVGLILAVALTACMDKAESNNDIATYELKQPGVTIKMTLEGKDDKIIKQTTDSVIEYSAIGAQDATQAKTILDEITNNTNYGAIQGITYSMEYGPTSAQESIVVDLTKADLKQLAELPGSAFQGDPAEGISFSATGTLLESSGFTKVPEAK